MESIQQLEEGKGTERELVEWRRSFQTGPGKIICIGKNRQKNAAQLFWLKYRVRPGIVFVKGIALE